MDWSLLTTSHRLDQDLPASLTVIHNAKRLRRMIVAGRGAFHCKSIDEAGPDVDDCLAVGG